MNPMEFAICMETEGEQFYMKQAENFQDTELAVVFRKLAGAEQRHAELIRERLAGLPVDVPENGMTGSVLRVFANIQNLMRQAGSLPDQMDAYSLAAGVEQRSIDLYTELLSASKDPSNQILLRYLLIQENEHLKLFEELTDLLNRPKEWVEAAEFGEREEY